MGEYAGGPGPTPAPRDKERREGGREEKAGRQRDGGESKKEEWKKARVEFVFICPRE